MNRNMLGSKLFAVMQEIKNLTYIIKMLSRSQAAFILSLIAGVFIMIPQAIAINKSTTSAPSSGFMIENIGRGFDSLSIHPNSEDWLLVECSKEINPEGDCHVLKYNLSTKALQRFVLPEGYLYGHASFSPLGNYIVLDRIPRHDNSPEGIRQSLANGQIVIMRSDGSDFSALPLSPGRKLQPIMAPDESKIAYWRSTPLKAERYAGDWADADIWEYDLQTQNDKIFAGPFHFFSGILSQYLGEDEVLLQTYATRETQANDSYKKRFNRSEIYKIKRGAKIFPDPLFTDIQGARSPSVDKSGNYYFHGENLPKVGSAYFKVATTGELVFWERPHFQSTGVETVSPNGAYLAFFYVAKDFRAQDHKRAVGILNIRNSEWLSVNIPSLTSSVAIIVKNQTT